MANALFTDPTCPWASLAVGPMVTCEQRLCAWVRQPSNSWSSLFFIALAILLFATSKKPDRIARDFGWIALLLGVTSFFAHASQTLLFSTMDYLAQFAVLSYIVVTNVRRRSHGTQLGFYRQYFLLFGMLAVIQLTFRGPGMIVISILLLLAIASECYAWLGTQKLPILRNWMLGLACMLGGVACFGLDASGTFCRPENHLFQLHSMWHLMTAGAIFFLVQHYKGVGII